MGLFDRPAQVRAAACLEAAQRAENQHIANAEDATASQVHRAALEYGLPELHKALQHGRPLQVQPPLSRHGGRAGMARGR